MNLHSIRFLVDESCDHAIVRALRAEGYDVLAINEIMQRSVDEDLVQPGQIRINPRRT